MPPRKKEPIFLTEEQELEKKQKQALRRKELAQKRKEKKELIKQSEQTQMQRIFKQREDHVKYIQEQEKLSQQQKEKLIERSNLDVKGFEPIFYETGCDWWTIQLETKTTAHSVKQLNQNSWEQQSIFQVNELHAQIQIISGHQVQISVGISSDKKFIICVSSTSTSSQLKNIFQIFISKISKFIPRNEAKILLSGGKKIDFEKSDFFDLYVLNHIKPFYSRKYESDHPQQNTHGRFTRSRDIFGEDQKIAPLSNLLEYSLLNVGKQDVYHLPEQNGDFLKQFYHKPNFSKRQQDEKDPDKIRDRDYKVVSNFTNSDKFIDKFLHGTQLSKQKKIGRAMQIIISTASFSIDQLKQVRTLFEQAYQKK